MQQPQIEANQDLVRLRLMTAHQKRESIARRDAGETLADIARTFGVSHTTIGRLTAAPAI